ncbi:hypothetical protein [Nocardioides massiliensis]|uniref:Uncharacterized protein n=1 Tax=Nocardioides massiliensis TaxID=1325935 RepID=A0ABT9NIZ1_9ACTN|nr:hypothetical protein [Nocardioides massiliensis]MDP9820383.1 hypothetical protein [Nocardioides massiliensis]
MAEKKFVTVVVEATGETQRVPAHYIDHPVLGEGIRRVDGSEPLDDLRPSPVDPDPGTGEGTATSGPDATTAGTAGATTSTPTSGAKTTSSSTTPSSTKSAAAAGNQE